MDSLPAGGGARSKSRDLSVRDSSDAGWAVLCQLGH